jgi:hypothetical protein
MENAYSKFLNDSIKLPVINSNNLNTYLMAGKNTLVAMNL